MSSLYRVVEAEVRKREYSELLCRLNQVHVVYCCKINSLYGCECGAYLWHILTAFYLTVNYIVLD